MYLEGAGVPQNYAQAIALFRKAAEQGEAKAQAFLGVMYEYGLGLERNPVLAFAYYTMAAAADVPPAVNQKAQIMSQLTPSQIDEGQRLATQWSPGKPLPDKATTWKASP